MKYEVQVEEMEGRFQCDCEEPVLTAMARLGRKGIPVGCRGGGCGVCKVQVTSGDYHTLQMSRQHVSLEEEADGTVLACRLFAHSDLQVRIVGKMKRALCRPSEPNPPCT